MALMLVVVLDLLVKFYRAKIIKILKDLIFLKRC